VTISSAALPLEAFLRHLQPHIYSSCL